MALSLSAIIVWTFAVLAACAGALWIVSRFFRGAKLDEFFDGPITGYSDPARPGRR